MVSFIFIGCQIAFAYPRWGLTDPLLNFRNITLSRCINDLLINLTHIVGLPYYQIHTWSSNFSWSSTLYIFSSYIIFSNFHFKFPTSDTVSTYTSWPLCSEMSLYGILPQCPPCSHDHFALIPLVCALVHVPVCVCICPFMCPCLFLTRCPVHVPYNAVYCYNDYLSSLPQPVTLFE